MIFKEVDLESLFRLMQEYDITETTIKSGKTEVAVKRDKGPVILNAGGVIERPAEPDTQSAGADGANGANGEKQGEADRAVPDDAPGPARETCATITTPLVGTFYRAPAPGDDPFVEVGDRINAGDVLCIVEAMKSMNEIQSDFSGVIREICVENAQLVEFEQALFKIDTAA